MVKPTLHEPPAAAPPADGPLFDMLPDPDAEDTFLPTVQNGAITPRGRALPSPGPRPIPEYQPVKVLGRGTFGDAELGHTSDGRSIVIKTINVGVVARKELEHSVREGDILAHGERLKSEVRTLDRLDDCPGVAHLVGYDTQGAGHILRIATEYVPGMQLTGLHHALNGQIGARIARQLLTTLDDCHSKGIAHLDINPNNVIFDDSQAQAKLIDFGSARFFTPGNPIIPDIRLSSPGTRGYIRHGDDDNVIKHDIYGVAQVLDYVLEQPPWPQATAFIDACRQGDQPISQLLTHPWLTPWSTP